MKKTLFFLLCLFSIAVSYAQERLYPVHENVAELIVPTSGQIDYDQSVSVKFADNSSRNRVVQRESEGYVPNVMVSNLINKSSEGEKSVKVSVVGILNYNNLAFTGKIQMAVADKNGSILQRFGTATDVNNLSYLSRLTFARSLDGELPSTLKDGEYRIYLQAQQEGYVSWSVVTGYEIENNTIKNPGTDCYFKFWVKDGNVTYMDPYNEYYPNVMVTDMTDNSNLSSGVITVKVAELLNKASTPFRGEVKLAFADSKGEILYIADGESITVSQDLGSNMYLVDPHYVTCSIPEGLKDGLYWVYLVARQSGYAQWAKVTKYVKTDKGITQSGLDCYLNYRRNNGVFSLVTLVYKIELACTSNQILVGGTSTVSATVLPEDAAEKDIAWSSSDETIATVKNGVVTGLKAGKVTITASATDGSEIEASVLITVSNPINVSEITFEKDLYQIKIGATEALTPKTSPDAVGADILEWSSSNTAIATVVDGVVTGLKEGFVVITATNPQDGNVKASVRVSVVDDENSMTADQLNNYARSLLSSSKGGIFDPSLDEYDKIMIDARLKLASIGGSKAEFKSILNSIVATIPATKAEYNIRNANASKYLGCDGGQGILTDETVDVKFEYAYSGFYIKVDGKYINMRGTDKWSISADEYPITAWKFTLENGTYTITGPEGLIGTDDLNNGSYLFGNKTASKNGKWNISKKAPEPILVTDITFEKDSCQISVGDSLILSPEVTPVDATNKKLRWSSSDKTIATVNENGIVTAIKEGSVTITASATDDSNVTSTINIVVYKPAPEEPGIADGTYLIRNVATGRYLNGSNSWGTKASVTKHGQFMTIAKREDGTYTIDSHYSNGGDKHYLAAGDNTFLDALPVGHTIEFVSEGFYAIKDTNGKYLSSDGVLANFNADEITDSEKWAFLTKDEFKSLCEVAAEPVDFTAFVPDANFSRNNQDINLWEGESKMGKGGPNTAADATAAGMNAEKWGGNSTSIDFHTTITDLPNGKYQVKFQGFYRYNNTTDNTNDVAAAAHADGTEVILSTFSANNVVVPFTSVADEAAVELYGKMPFSQTEASEAFTLGAYQNSIEVNVTNGTLTLAVTKNEADHIGCDWTILDNIELYYLGDATPECPAISFDAVDGAVIDLADSKAIHVTVAVPEGMDASDDLLIEGVVVGKDGTNQPIIGYTDFEDCVDVDLSRLTPGNAYTIMITKIAYGEVIGMDEETYMPIYSNTFVAEEGEALASIGISIAKEQAAPEVVSITVNPIDHKSVAITFNTEDANATYNVPFALETADGAAVNTTIDGQYGVNYGDMIYSFGAELYDGDYVLVLPAGSMTFALDGTPYNEEVRINFTITDNPDAIIGIAADGAADGKYLDENGKVVIVKGGVKYNAAGQVVR